MAMFEAYFDESGCDDGSKILAVGGYLFESERAKRMDKKWRRVLKEFDLPFFHMVDCAHHAPPFDKLTQGQCINVEKRMIDLIKKHAIIGFVSIVNPSRFHNNQGEDAYTFCVQSVAYAMAAYLEDIDPLGKLALFFEAGHQNGPKASVALLESLSKGRLKRFYTSHTFVRKEEAPLVQSADLLSWQYAKFIKDKVWSTRKPRKDYASLMQHKHHVIFVTAVDRTGIMATDDNPGVLESEQRDKVITAFFSDDEAGMKAFTSQAIDPDRISPAVGSETGKVFTTQIDWDAL